MPSSRLPKPVRPKKSAKNGGYTNHVWWLRKRVPPGLQSLVGSKEVWRSLDTTDLRTANQRIGGAVAKLEAEWTKLAAGLANQVPIVPQLPLTHQDLHALRGAAHVRARNALVVNPPSGFERVRLVAVDDETLIEEARAILSEDGAAFTDADVERFAPLLRRARQDAADDGRRAADGDYSPNPVLARLPSRTTKLDLLWAFEFYAENGGIKGGKLGRTAKRWRPKIKLFVNWLGHRDLTRMTPDDAYRWMDHLIEEKFARKSIKNVWLASLSAVAGYMIERGKLKAANPFYGIRVRDEIDPAVINAAPAPRKKGFTRDEAVTILTATLLTSSALTSLETKAARRWLPWLCAYSGARVNELTSLYPSDIAEDVVTGIWCMNIKPSLEKTAVWRQVPIHSHILKQKGFLEYVESRRKIGKPLFYDPARGRGGTPGNPQFAKVAERLAEWLHKEKLIPAGLLPNHAWRHLFKSTARKLEMDRDVEGFITGHRPRDSGSGFDYGDRWVETMSREIEKYPPFEIAALGLPATPHKRLRRSPEQVTTDDAAKAARKAARATRAA